MTRAFTETGKDHIRRNLLQKGREYFIKYGIKKTSVAELARAVGIAKGSFYKFFASKEALFFAIHEDSERKLRMDLMQKLEGAGEPAAKLRLFLKNSFLIMEEDPLLRVVFNIRGFEDLSHFMTSEQFKEHYSQSIVFMIELLRQWQKEDTIGQLDAEVASHMIASAFYIFPQKENLGEQMYARVKDMLVECMVNYLSGTK